MVERGLLEETADLLASGVLDPASPPGRAIGYRQAIEYLQRPDVEYEEAEGRALKAFLEDFATATRRYAKQQMVWYRGACPDPRLGGGQAGKFGRGAFTPRASHSHTMHAHVLTHSCPTTLPAQPEFVWLRWDLQDLPRAQTTLRACYEEGPGAHAERRAGPEQAALREENLQEGKRMKRYVSTVLAEVKGERLQGLVQRAWACRQRLREAPGAMSA